MRRGGLYLVGHCHLRQAVRVFAVERIRAAEVLANTFSRPAGFDVEVLEPAALRREAERVVLALGPRRKPLARAGTVRAHAPRRPGAARAPGHGR